MLRKASRALEGDRDRDRGDRRRDAEPKPPKRPAGVPFADWNQDCKDVWLIVEIARATADARTVEQLRGFSTTACSNPNGIGRTNWPNGGAAKSSSGTLYYPNGGTAKSSSGTFYYPNGGTAKSSSGTWYYPNGGTAKSSSGTWFHANGAQAGGWEVVVNDACTRGGEAVCAHYRRALGSDIEDWRTFAVVQLVSRAN